MVNVPGRSKGCKTCRLRKLRCSLERPECIQCIKSGRSCLGYERQRIFVNSDIVLEAKKEKVRHKMKEPVAKRHHARMELKRKALQRKEPKEEQVVLLEPLEKSMITDPRRSHGLIVVSVRQQLLATYVSQYEYASACSAPDGCTWITTIPSMLNPTKALESAAYALSLARLSTSLNSRDMEQESLKVYTEGLHYFQRALWNPKLMYSDETLAACVLLTMYEVFQCPSNSRTAYVNHQSGCARLIQLRGPIAHSYGLGHSIFQWFRFMGTLEAMRTKSTFLSADEWKTIPFSIYAKSPFQRILDHLLEAPNILARAESIVRLPPSELAGSAVELLQDCIKVESGLQELSKYFEAAGACSSRITSFCSSPKEMVKSFTAERVPKARTDTATILTWAGLTVFWSGISRLYGLVGYLTALTPTVTGALTGQYVEKGVTKQFYLPDPRGFMDFATMARKVYGSVKLCMEDELSILMLSCPLHMIIEGLSTWPGYEYDIAQAKDVLTCIQKKGMKIVLYDLDS